MNEYWRGLAEERIRTMEHWLNGSIDPLTGIPTRGYNDSITDIPVYLEMFCYVFMALVMPRKKIITKEEPNDE